MALPAAQAAGWPSRFQCRSPGVRFRSFAAAAITLLAEFNSYLDRPGANPTADAVSYRQGTIWATPEELTTLTKHLIALLAPTLANQATPGRRPYLLSPILFPTSDSQ